MSMNKLQTLALKEKPTKTNGTKWNGYIWFSSSFQLISCWFYYNEKQ